VITTVSELKGNELIKNIYDGIIRKLDSARLLVHYDKEMAAGLYTYAIEEFGKLLLVKESKLTNNLYEINSDWFKGRKAHKDKFPKAFDYLQENNHGQCIVLTEGDFAVNEFHWRHFMIGLLADFEARLSIFYSGFNPKGNFNDIDIVKIPNVDSNTLEDAIKELEQVTQKLP
jgi:hypothetical protein